jgi:hypothetical protein
MKEFIKHPFVILLVVILAAMFTFFKTCTHEVTYKGTVLSHHTTSDRYGEIEYYTVARFEDGYIRSMEGLQFYVKPVGSTVYYTQTMLNKK